MPSLEFEVKQSAGAIPGKCVKCLAEEELHTCLRELLIGEGDDLELQRKYEMLVAFLQSPESQELRVESERYLSEGKKVTLKITSFGGKQEYGLEIS